MNLKRLHAGGLREKYGQQILRQGRTKEGGHGAQPPRARRVRRRSNKWRISRGFEEGSVSAVDKIQFLRVQIPGPDGGRQKLMLSGSGCGPQRAQKITASNKNQGGMLDVCFSSASSNLNQSWKETSRPFDSERGGKMSLTWPPLMKVQLEHGDPRAHLQLPVAERPGGQCV
jgi:hypothetical protein